MININGYADRIGSSFRFVATATEVPVATNEFRAINDPKKTRPFGICCHAGVTPSEYRSVSSVCGKAQVSQRARLRLKSFYHSSAMSVIRMKGQLRNYYQRKVEKGKNKMLALNEARNKLIPVFVL